MKGAPRMKKSHAMKRLLPGLALLVGLAGCASTPDLRFYTLSDAQPVAKAAMDDAPGALTVARVRVPEYLDDRRLWVRTGDHRLETLPYVRWAESLPRAVTRYLQQRLGAPAETGSVGEGPRLLVDLDHFEARWGQGGEPDRMILSGRWQLEGQPGATHSIHEELALESRDAASLVAAKSRLLERLVEQVARASGAAG